MAHSDEPPFLTVGTEVSAKYRGAFCEATIKVAKKLVRCKVAYSKGLCTTVNSDQIRGTLKVGGAVEVRQGDGQYQSGSILRLTDMSTYTVVFDDGDERTLKRSSLCLKGARHFHESESLDHLPLTDPENFGTPVMQSSRKYGRKRRRPSHSSSAEEEAVRKKVCYPPEFPVGKTVFLENDRRRSCWLPAVVVPVHFVLEESEWTPDSICIRSFKDGRFFATTKDELHDFAPDKEPLLSMLEGEIQAMYMHKPAIERAMAYRDTGELPWDMNLFEPKHEQSASPPPLAGREEEEEETDSEEKRAFMERLRKYHEGKGTSLTRQPTLGQKDLDLWRLYRLVQDNGGFDKVTQEMKWRSLYLQLGMPPMSTASYATKQAYKRYLYPLETQDKGKAKSKDSPVRGSRRRTANPVPPAAPPTPPDATPTPPTVTQESDEERGGKAAGRPTKQTSKDSSKRKRLESKSDGSDQESSQADSVSTQATSGEEGASKPNGVLPLRSESFAENDRVLVWYGKGKTLRTYEAKVLGVEESELHRDYLVHYNGWNIRYDEWVEEARIAGRATGPSTGSNRPMYSSKKKRKKKDVDAKLTKEDAVKSPASTPNPTSDASLQDSWTAPPKSPPKSPPTLQPESATNESNSGRTQGRSTKRRRLSAEPDPPPSRTIHAASPSDPPSSAESEGSRKTGEESDSSSSPTDALRAAAEEVEGNEEGGVAVEVKREENERWSSPASESTNLLLCSEQLPAPGDVKRKLEVTDIKIEREATPPVPDDDDVEREPSPVADPAPPPDHPPSPPPQQPTPSPPEVKEEEEEEEVVMEEESNGKSVDDKSSVVSSGSEKEGSPPGHRLDGGRGKDSPGKRKSKEWETEEEYEERKRQRRADMNYLINFSTLPEMSSSERVSLIQDRLREVQKKWCQLKAEVSSLDRRRRKARRKGREAARNQGNQASQQQSSAIQCH